MESSGGNAAIDRPLDRLIKSVRCICIQAKNKTSINHDAEVVQAVDCPPIISAQILGFSALCEIGGG